MSANKALEKAWKEVREGYHPVVVEVMIEALTAAQEVQEDRIQTRIRETVIEGLDQRVSPDGTLDKELAEKLIASVGDAS